MNTDLLWTSAGGSAFVRKGSVVEGSASFYPFPVFFFFFSFVILGSHHSVWRFPGVQSELYLLAYTTARATWDPSHICDLHHSS